MACVCVAGGGAIDGHDVGGLPHLPHTHIDGAVHRKLASGHGVLWNHFGNPEILKLKERLLKMHRADLGLVIVFSATPLSVMYTFCSLVTPALVR